MSVAEDSPQKLLVTSLSNGRVDVLRTLLSELGSKNEFNDVLNSLSTESGTLLHHAVKLGDVDAVRTLLSCGANPCIPNLGGFTAFQLATDTPRIRQVFEQELLQSVAQSKLSRICQLLSCGIPVNFTDSPLTKNSPLHWAASYGSPDVVKILCEGGGNVDALNALGDTPLHDAIQRKDVHVVETLLAYHADPDAQNAAGLTCYELAKTKGSPEVFKFLNSYGMEQSLAPIKGERSPSISSQTSLLNGHQLSLQNGQNLPMANGTIPNVVEPVAPPTPSWKDWLWPIPQHLSMTPGSDRYFSHNGKIHVIVDRIGWAHRSEILDIWAEYETILSRYDITTDVYAEVTGPTASLRSGGAVEEKRSCLILSLCQQDAINGESYKIIVTEATIRVCAWQMAGLRYALSSVVDLLLSTREDDSNAVPCLRISDRPAVRYRCVCFAISASTLWSIDTLARSIRLLWSLKINTIVLHFDHYRLAKSDEKSITGATSSEADDDDLRRTIAYTAAELEVIRNACESLGMSLAPSVEIYDSSEGGTSSTPSPSSSSSADDLSIISGLLMHFPGAPFIQLGPKLTHRISNDPRCEASLCCMRKFVPLIFYTFQSPVEDLAFLTAESDPGPASSDQLNLGLPLFCTPLLSVDAFSQDIDPSHNNTAARTGRVSPSSLLMPVGLTVDAQLGRTLCPIPEKITQKWAVASRLIDELQPLMLQIRVCPWSGVNAHGTLLESRTFAFPLLSLIAGAAWNPHCSDKAQVVARLPRITALSLYQIPQLEKLVAVVLQLGSIEAQVEGMSSESTAKSGRYGQAANANSRPSVMRQLLVKPDDANLDLKSAVVFKKAKIRLNQCLARLIQLKTEIPYDFDLAVSLAEVQLASELLLVAAKLGISLCIMGSNPGATVIGSSVVNVGVANLNLTTRTDLANRVLRLRTTFQHTWLSSHAPATLPAAQEFFDKLLRILLPPSLHDGLNQANTSY